jgi:uncharacterized protein YcnI
MKKPLKSVGVCAIALGAGILIALTPAAAASAHVSASATSTAAGSSTVVTFSVPHGCDGSPTTVVTIEVPESVPAVTPTVNPSWTVEKVVEQLAEPLMDAHGNEITERVTSVVYATTGAGLADGYRDTFELSLRLPDGEAGDVVAFPVVQTCAEGTAEWVGEDAPSVTLTAAVEGDGHGEVAAEAPPGASDPLARVFGVAGLVVGAVGVVIAVLGRRSARA